MPTCARCGAEEAGPPGVNMHRDYNYCDECNETFNEVYENGVVVRSRHTNRASHMVPYEVGVRGNVEDISYDATRPNNQTEALAMGKELMAKHSLPGLFIYQKTGSVWLVDEYLEAHPGIAEDVHAEMGGGGFLSRFI